MISVRRLAGLPAFALPLLLSGCSYFLPTKRHLPAPVAPPNVQTISPEDLVKQINSRWDAVNSLTATVEIAATQTKTSEGASTATDFPTCRGYIVMQKPNKLRVLGKLFGMTIFDMASDGSRFTLVIPKKNMAVEGPNVVHEKSANPLENLRPDFFLDAIVVRGLDPDDEYMVTSDTETVPDAANKHLYIEPEYTLSVTRRKTGRENQPVRTVTFHRDDMLPYDQYVYDKNGALETQIFYGNYQTFAAGRYPAKITVKRPQEGIQFVLTVERVEENLKDMSPDQFEVKIPDGTTVRQLK
jgi:hypothetical protein